MGDKNDSGSSKKYAAIGTGLGLLVGAGAALYTYYNSQNSALPDNPGHSSSQSRNSSSSSSSSPSKSQAKSKSVKISNKSTISDDPKRQLPPGW